MERDHASLDRKVPAGVEAVLAAASCVLDRYAAVLMYSKLPGAIPGSVRLVIHLHNSVAEPGPGIPPEVLARSGIMPLTLQVAPASARTWHRSSEVCVHLGGSRPYSPAFRASLSYGTSALLGAGVAYAAASAPEPSPHRAFWTLVSAVIAGAAGFSLSAHDRREDVAAARAFISRLLDEIAAAVPGGGV